MESYRYLIENLVIGFSQRLTVKDFIDKDKWFSTNRLEKRQALFLAKYLRKERNSWKPRLPKLILNILFRFRASTSLFPKGSQFESKLKGNRYDVF